ncbi:HAMP domain-containing protein [Microvirga lotononidis]|uniref:HAMP domain-containing protein n=2 Tax=Microvirga lotononidis TaxID=864069 RepID=I4YKX4_9HYPH|nr:HAMP domain-containing protein [Microvirga lotononidis]
MGLRLKFNIILAVCYLIGLGLSIYPFYQISRREAMEQLQSQIDVLRAQALSVRRYTSEEIQPLLAEHSSIQFLPQTVPSFSAQTSFRNFRGFYPQFFYKEAALNPTNPADLARDWERELIEKLRANPDLAKDISFQTIDNRSHYTVTYPLVIKDESCLTCHSTPDRAPTSMVALYGNKNGFGWKLNETIGAQIISVPMDIAEGSIWRNLGLFVGTSSVIFLVLLVLLNVLLNRYVISPVTRMAKTAEAVSMGDATIAEFEYPGSDEIASLSRSFNRMRRSLDSALKMLEK